MAHRYVIVALVALAARASLAQYSFDCTHLAPGDYPVSQTACEPTFFKCTQGAKYGVSFDCPGGTMFDADSSRCLYEAYVPACGGTATPIPDTTTPQSDPTPAPFRFRCGRRPSGDYANPQTPCSSDYVTCDGGVAHFRQCPNDLKFDIISGECLEDAYVKVCGGESTTRAPVTTIAPADFDCTGLADGRYANPYEACSDRYYVCTNGRAWAGNCPAELRFDVASSRCVLNEFVDACGGQSTPIPVTTTRAPVFDDTRFSCVNLEPGTYEDTDASTYTDYGVCSRVFFVCTGAPFGAVHECPRDLYYDSTQDRCDYFQDTPACSGRPNPVEDEATPAPQGPPAPEGFCDARGVGNFELEENQCGPDYVACADGGRGVILWCPSETYYDVELDQCGTFETVPACNGGVRVTTTTTEFTPVAQDPALVRLCRTRPNGNYAVEGECSESFVTCDNGRAHETVCPGNTRYNEETDECLDAADVPGCPVIADEGERDLDAICTGNANGFYAVPDSCTEYVFCAYDRATLLDCVDGELFSQRLGHCVPANPELRLTCGRQLADVEPFECSGLAPGFYTRAGDCMNYFFCESDGSAWTFECEPGFTFNTDQEACVPIAEMEQCVPPRMSDPEVVNFCLRRQDGVFSNPIDCSQGIICLQRVALRLECTIERPMFDSAEQRCVSELTADSNCVPPETARFVSLSTFVGV